MGLRVSANAAVSLPLTYAFVANLALFWAVSAQRHTPWLARSGWLLLLAGLGLSVAILLGTHFSTAKLPFIDRSLYAPLPERWHAFWDQESFNPNISGGLLALFLPPAVALIWGGAGWQQRDIAKLVAVVVAGVLLLTQSRGALLASIVALLVITSLHSRRWWFFWVAVLVGVSLAAYRLGPAPLLETLLGRSDLFGDRSLQARIELWQRAWYLLREFPLTGVGLGMVEPAIKQLSPTVLIRPDANFNHVHNIYLQVGAELGLPGLLAHAVLYLSLFYRLWQRATDPRAGYRRVLALGLLGSLTVLLIHGLVDAIIASPQAALVVWGLLGLMAAVATPPVGESDTYVDTLPPR